MRVEVAGLPAGRPGIVEPSTPSANSAEPQPDFGDWDL